MQADHKIQTNVVTPIDSCSYVQVLRHTMEYGDSQLITVQLVHPNVRAFEANLDEGFPNNTHGEIMCPLNHYL